MEKLLHVDRQPCFAVPGSIANVVFRVILLHGDAGQSGYMRGATTLFGDTNHGSRGVYSKP